jgi:hypothetical protein
MNTEESLHKKHLWCGKLKNVGNEVLNHSNVIRFFMYSFIFNKSEHGLYVPNINYLRVTKLCNSSGIIEYKITNCFFEKRLANGELNTHCETMNDNSDVSPLSKYKYYVRTKLDVETSEDKVSLMKIVSTPVFIVSQDDMFLSCISVILLADLCTFAGFQSGVNIFGVMEYHPSVMRLSNIDICDWVQKMQFVDLGINIAQLEALLTEAALFQKDSFNINCILEREEECLSAVMRREAMTPGCKWSKFYVKAKILISTKGLKLLLY